MRVFKYILCYLLFFTLSFLLLENFFGQLNNIIVSTIWAFSLLFLLTKTTVLNTNFNTILFVAFFILILFAPFVGKKQDESLEKRILKEFPEWRWTNVWKFFKEYQAYFEDRFAFRNELIDLNGKIRYEFINGTELTPNVALGKDNWLFYCDNDYLNYISTPFSKEELKQFNYNLNIITKWFQNKGINYYLTIAPVKAMVYKEMMPDYMKIRTEFSRYNQLKSYLEKNSSIQFISYLDELKEGKKQQEIYYKTDTHWNEIGAFIGYTKIMNVISKDYPELKPYKIEEFNVVEDNFFGGDLMSILGYESAKPTKQFYINKKDGSYPRLIFSEVLPENNLNIFEMPNNDNKNSIYVVRDSFSESLKKFLSLNFSKSVYYWKVELPINTILEEKPTIVLHEILERFSFFYLELPPEIKADTAFTNQFNIDDF